LLIRKSQITATDRHGNRAPHKDIIPLAKEISGGGNWPE
jgi:hypothetical protein